LFPYLFYYIDECNHEIKFVVDQFFELNLNMLSVFYERSLNSWKIELFNFFEQLIKFTKFVICSIFDSQRRKFFLQEENHIRGYITIWNEVYC